VTVGTHKTRREVLALLSVMEAPSSHPLAATLVNAAKEEGVSSNDMTVLRHQILKGEGVTALVNGDEVYVGNVKLFERLGFYDHLDSTYKEKAEEWNNEGGTVGFLGVKGIGIVGMFCVADHVRPEAMEVVSTLVNDNYNVMMLTGDGNGAANGVARKVGLPLENIRSQFLPEDKLHFVSSTMGLSKRRGDLFSSKELLLFVGDGVNGKNFLNDSYACNICWTMQLTNTIMK
jgi:Cd2+/Zn2+-exporting ATPase